MNIFEPSTGGSWDLALPPGGELNDMILWEDQGGVILSLIQWLQLFKVLQFLQ